MATYNGNNTIDTTALKVGDVITFAYSGAAKSISLPAGTYKLQVWGAQGGTYSTYTGGAGGYSVGTITLADEATTVYAYVGGQPAADSTISASGTTPGGFNGGGTGKNRSYSGTSSYGQGGGGGTDFRIGGNTLYYRVIVAGGGGGSSSAVALTTKYGGGTSGGSPTTGYGASQTSAGTNGSFGQGGAAQSNGYNYKYGSGGGGGGWYGGGACSSYSDSTNYQGYNGGGSGFVWTGSNAPSGYMLTAAHYLTDADTYAGNTLFPSASGGTETGHQGNGYAQITVVSLPATGGEVYIKKTVEEFVLGSNNGAYAKIGSSLVSCVSSPVNVVKHGGNHWLIGTTETDTSKTGLYYSPKLSSGFQQLNIDVELLTGGGCVYKVIDVEYNDGLWLALGETQENTGDSYFVLLYAEDDDITNWTKITFQNVNSGSANFVKCINGIWLWSVYNVSGGLQYTTTPKDSSSWAFASLASSTGIFPSTCYSIAYSVLSDKWVVGTSSGIYYSQADLTNFEQSNITSAVKKVLALDVADGSMESTFAAISLSNSEMSSIYACSESDGNIWGTVIDETASLIVYDGAICGNLIIFVTSSGIIAMNHSTSGLFALSDSIISQMIAVSGTECIVSDTTSGVVYKSSKNSSFLNWGEIAQDPSGSIFTSGEYDISLQWIKANATYVKVSGAWKKADSVSIKKDSLWYLK